MDIESFRFYCLNKPGVTEDLPFGPDTLVFKVMEKMFALTNLEWESFKVNLKCNPAEAEQLRADYPDVQPGYHMNKKHWNTIQFDNGLSEAFLKTQIDNSYNLVVKGLTKKAQAALKDLE